MADVDTKDLILPKEYAAHFVDGMREMTHLSIHDGCLVVRHDIFVDGVQYHIEHACRSRKDLIEKRKIAKKKLMSISGWNGL